MTNSELLSHPAGKAGSHTHDCRQQLPKTVPMGRGAQKGKTNTGGTAVMTKSGRPPLSSPITLRPALRPDSVPLQCETASVTTISLELSCRHACSLDWINSVWQVRKIHSSPQDDTAQGVSAGQERVLFVGLHCDHWHLMMLQELVLVVCALGKWEDVYILVL